VLDASLVHAARWTPDCAGVTERVERRERLGRDLCLPRHARERGHPDLVPHRRLGVVRREGVTASFAGPSRPCCPAQC
jgi:hypothetical protein